MTQHMIQEMIFFPPMKVVLNKFVYLHGDLMNIFHSNKLRV